MVLVSHGVIVEIWYMNVCDRTDCVILRIALYCVADENMPTDHGEVGRLQARGLIQAIQDDCYDSPKIESQIG